MTTGKNKTKNVSWLLIIICLLPIFCCPLLWGINSHATLLLAIFIITLSGVLIGGRKALIGATIVNGSLIVIIYLWGNITISTHGYWQGKSYEFSSIAAHIIMILAIFYIFWLAGLEIKRTLKWAQQKEATLQRERDLLEIKIIERTEQLHRAEAEKINQLYRLAEFGRLSSGIFHDLVNPLTAVSLNLEQIKGGAENKVSDAKSYLSQALLATKKMEGLITSIKKQIQQEDNKIEFSLNTEISQVIQILSYKARQANTRIIFSAATKVVLYGEAIKFGQIIINLLANAIEAGENSGTGNGPEKVITINLETFENNIILTVSDQGVGIASENIDKIFEPFFSTKKENDRGLGIGLASTKNIVEKNFGGTITVKSRLNHGTIFTVLLPLR
jgi:signal transduction histidine kinase